MPKTISESLGTHADLQGWDIHSKYHILLEYVEMRADEEDFEKFVQQKAEAENAEMAEDWAGI